MFQFDNNGYLKPYQPIITDIKGFEKQFANSAVRKVIFKEYLLFLEELQGIQPHSFMQWINGSFTTQKPLPFDIDLVTFVDYSTYFMNVQKFKKLEKKYSKIDAHFSVDFPEGHRKAYETHLDKLYWQDVYGTDRYSRPKGFLQIQILNHDNNIRKR